MGFFTRKDWRDQYRRLPDGELLERIRTGDQLAEAYLWVTYQPIVSVHMEVELKKYGKPEQLGTPDEYAHDAIIKLLTDGHLLGVAVLRHEYSTIGGWLKQTATNFMRNAIRKDNRNDRDNRQVDDDADNETRSAVDMIEDKGADAFADMPKKERHEIIEEVLATLPKELETLVRKRLMDDLPWATVSAIMVSDYPGHNPSFELAYLQKTYWDRVHKKPFYKNLRDAFKRYGYDF